MFLNCNGLPQKRLYFKRRVWHNIKQNLSILYSGSLFLGPNAHVYLMVLNCLWLHFSSLWRRVGSKEDMPTGWKLSFPSLRAHAVAKTTCELCFGVCVLQHPKINRSSGPYPWGSRPSTGAQRSLLSVTVCKQQLLPEAFPGYFRPFLTSLQDSKNKVNLHKAVRKSLKIRYWFMDKISKTGSQWNSDAGGVVINSNNDA